MDAWYYARDGQQHGPYPKGELIGMLVSGSVRPTDHVWTEGMGEWQLANEVPGLITSHVGTAGLADTLPPEQPQPAAVQVPNYLPWAIAATICCCMVGGIFAIIYSVRATAAADRGDIEAALNAAAKAKLWLIWSAILGAFGPFFTLVASLLSFA